MAGAIGAAGAPADRFSESYKRAARFATIIDFCEFLVIDSIARGTQRLRCSVRGSMAMELHTEQFSR